MSASVKNPEAETDISEKGLESWLSARAERHSRGAPLPQSATSAECAAGFGCQRPRQIAHSVTPDARDLMPSDGRVGNFVLMCTHACNLKNSINLFDSAVFQFLGE